MLAERLEVRLDSEHRRRLMEIASVRGKPISDIVRDLIDTAYDEVDRAKRLRAAEELGKLEIEDVPEPDVLARQLDGTYELPDLR
jgi:predicted DNA-binding protein